jgi:hypothetical protein
MKQCKRFLETCERAVLNATATRESEGLRSSAGVQGAGPLAEAERSGEP